MSTIDAGAGGTLWVHTKGAPELLLARCTEVMDAGGSPVPLTDERRAAVGSHDESLRRRWPPRARSRRQRRIESTPPAVRDDVERDLCLLGLVAMLDPPRAEVADAVARCHEAGIRIMVVTGDHPLTAAEVARRVSASTARSW